MVEVKGRYIYGSTAEKLEENPLQSVYYDAYENNVVLKAKRENKKAAHVKAEKILIIMAVFAVCFAVLYRYVLIVEMGYQEMQLTEKLEALRKENQNIQMEIDKLTNLEYIENVAKTRLNMQKPDQHQIVYIKVPKTDHAEFADQRETKVRTPNADRVGAKLVEKVGLLLEYIF